jgi:16S rRNA processing protein RimM
LARKSFAARVKGRRSPAAPSRAGPAAPSAGAAVPGKPTHPQPPARSKPQAEPDDGFVAVGRVLAPFGLKGELKVQAMTDNPARFRPKARLWAGQQPISVAKSREAQGYVYLMLKGFNDRTSVEKFRHALLQVPEGDLPPLPEGEYYRFQLVGLAVVEREGSALGTLDEIIETGANDVYRVRAEDGADILLPALADVIVSVDLTARRMVVDPPAWRQ